MDAIPAKINEGHKIAERIRTAFRSPLIPILITLSLLERYQQQVQEACLKTSGLQLWLVTATITNHIYFYILLLS